MSSPTDVDKGVREASDRVLAAMDGLLIALVKFLSLLGEKNSPEAIAQLRQVANQMDTGLKQTYNRNQDSLIQNPKMQELPTMLPKLVAAVQKLGKEGLEPQAQEIDKAIEKYMNAMNTFKASLKPEAPKVETPQAGRSTPKA